METKANYVAVGGFVLVCLLGLVIALLWLGGGGASALLAAFLVGLGMGSEVDIIAFLMSRYFGLRSLGRTIGFALGAFRDEYRGRRRRPAWRGN